MNLRTFNYKLAGAAGHHQAGRLDIAVRQYEKLRAVRPGEPEVCMLLGTARLQQGQGLAAATLLALAVEAKPDAPAIWHRRLGLAYSATGLPELALAAHLRAANLGQEAADWRLAAQATQALGQPTEALKHLQRGVTVAPDEALGWSELGFAYQTIGCYAEAGQCHARALELDPTSVPSRLGQSQVRQQLCQIPEAVAGYASILADHPGLDYAASHVLVAGNYLEPDALTLANQHRVYGQKLGAPVNRPARPSHPRLKVGILSPDLRHHSCAYFLEPLLEFKPSQLDVHLYYDHLVSDDMTDRLQRQVGGQLQRVAHEGNAQLEARLLSDKLDVVVDLAGHFGRNRLGVLAHRVAPVQVAYLGYPNTTGVTAMDYRLADPRVDLAAHADHFVETLAYCAGGLWAYRPHPAAPVPGSGPSAPKFGYFGMLSKLSPQCLQVWAALVNQTGVPLLLKGDGLDQPALVAYWTDRLLGTGFKPGLFELRNKTRGTAEHLKMYDELTVALDPWPYNGTTTVCEALWQGVPTVALAGDRHAARVASGLLAGAGLDRFVANSTDEFVAVAAGLVAQPVRLSRAQLGLASWLDHRGVAEALWATVSRLARVRQSG